MNKRHYEHTLPNIRGSLSNTYPYMYGIIYICSMKKHPYKRFIDYLFWGIHLCEISFKYSSTFPKKEVR